MLRFKSFLNERRDAQHPYTDDQINKGLGSVVKNYDQEQATRKSLQDLMPKLPDNAAITKARKIQNPETSNPESEKNLNIPKVQAPELPKPFSHPSPGEKARSFRNFDEYMKTGKTPSPNLHANPQAGGPIGIPDAGGHQATVHVHNPATGQMDSTPSPVPHQVSVHIKNPLTGSSLEVSPQTQEASQQASSPPQQAPQQASPQSHKPTDDTYSSMLHKSFENLRGIGIPIPHMGGGQSHNSNWRDQPGRRQGSSPQASPQPQQVPQASPPQVAPQASPQGPSDRTERPGEAPALKFSKKAQDAYREAETFKNDPEAALKKMLGSKYVAP